MYVPRHIVESSDLRQMYAYWASMCREYAYASIEYDLDARVYRVVGFVLA